MSDVGHRSKETWLLWSTFASGKFGCNTKRRRLRALSAGFGQGVTACSGTILMAVGK